MPKIRTHNQSGWIECAEDARVSGDVVNAARTDEGQPKEGDRSESRGQAANSKPLSKEQNEEEGLLPPVSEIAAVKAAVLQWRSVLLSPRRRASRHQFLPLRSSLIQQE